MSESTDSSECHQSPKRTGTRKVYRYAILAALGLVGLTVVWFILLPRLNPPRYPLEIASERIEIGMQIDEAISIIGRPCDGEVVSCDWSSPGDRRPITYKDWGGAEGQLEISSFEERVVKKTFVPTRRDTPLDRIRRWLGM